MTNQYLLEAKEVISAWGFKYSTCITWCKTPKGGGLGGAHKINTEFLLFCRRGKLKAIGSHIGTHHHVKRPYNEKGHPEHSRKPEYFADLIEKVSPGPYLEMFARRERTGWDVWGNQVENSIEFNH